MEHEFSRRFLEVYSNIKFRENLSSGSRGLYANVQTDMTKLLGKRRNFGKCLYRINSR